MTAELLASLLAAKDSQEVLRRGCETSVARTCDWCVGFIAKEHNSFQVSWASHRSKRLAPVARKLKGQEWDSLAPILGAAALTKKRVLILKRTRTTDPENKTSRIFQKLEHRSCLVLPLIRRKETLGCLLMVRSSNRPFSQQDRAMAETLGRCLVPVLAEFRSLETSRRALESRNDFLMVASHEFETPLTSLKLDLELLKRWIPASLKAPKFEEAISRIDRQTNRMTRLIDQTIDFSKASTGSLVLNPERVCLNRLVSDVLDKFLWMQPTLCDALSFHREGDIHGDWDRRRIEDVVYQLVANALKFGEGRPVSVSTRSIFGGMAELRITDSGPGIPGSQKHQIFKAFGRASSSHHFGGLGVGLHLASEIVRLHGGTIQTEERNGSGTEVIVELPTALRPDFQAIFSAHLQWKERITHYVNGRSAERLSVEEIADDRSCTLGDWILREIGRLGSDQPKLAKRLRTLKRQHEDFHREAGKIISVTQTHGSERAKSLLAPGRPFSKSSTNVIRLLKKLMNELPPAG